ncbi:hypothetical protein ACFV9D_24745 [Streptomyces sp. NPDC059875]|uniref:hypothetical protein n=1 Tax=unclassified Streptomyces TaxID=2593676 RepID=UPI00365A7469
MTSRHDLAQHGLDVGQTNAKFCPQNAHDRSVPRRWIYLEARCSTLGEQSAPQLGRQVTTAHARSSPLDATSDKGYDLWDEFARSTRERYEPYRWQVIDQRLGEDATKKCMKELTFRQQELDLAAKHRAQKKNSSTT